SFPLPGWVRTCEGPYPDGAVNSFQWLQVYVCKPLFKEVQELTAIGDLVPLGIDFSSQQEALFFAEFIRDKLVILDHLFIIFRYRKAARIFDLKQELIDEFFGHLPRIEFRDLFSRLAH